MGDVNKPGDILPQTDPPTESEPPTSDGSPRQPGDIGETPAKTSEPVRPFTDKNDPDAQGPASGREVSDVTPPSTR